MHVLHDLATTLWVVNIALALPLTILAFYTAYWMTYAWHSPERHDASIFVNTTDSTAHSFSIIVPVRDEPYSVVSATVRRLLDQTHPNVQAIISVGHDDPSTLEVARRLQAEHPGRVNLAISMSDVHNKPTQLNAALPYCTGDIVGILDAESLSAPTLLCQVDAAFQQSGVTIVQGGVVMVNHRASALALRSSLEYYLHHRSKAHYSASKNAILMGGNTVFFHRELLVEVGGWDATNLAEDAEIGIRLMARGHNVTVAYDPHLVTQEEAPETLVAWVKQRTRWNLGFLQTLTKGVWRELPTKGQRRFALWALLQPSLMAVTGIAMLTAIVSFATVKPPLWITMFSFLPLLPTAVMVMLEAATLATYGREMNQKIRLRDYARLLASAPVYQILMAFAALRATYKYARGDLAWAKTTHVGAHLEAART